ncbi:TolC family protein [Flavobacterium sp.]|jgi:outer membrane protein TolC|uniref:TolC family protein n=1 Tax=Flavobacterium sp. TaxID=239 RepID=UPI0037C02516
MKTKSIVLSVLFLFGSAIITAQERKIMSLKEAVSLVVSNSNEVVLANTKVATSKLELETMKNNQYPTIKVSGQYLRLTNANVNSNLGGSGTALDVSQLLLGQANVSMPIFSGFKLKNSIAASENLYQAQSFTASHTKEALALEVVELFATLYKSNEMVTLLNENIKSAQQRTKDFSAMVDNGLLARNDLLKTQLQESNLELSLATAIKNVNVVNYQLATLLRLPENTIIDIDIETVKSDMAKNQLLTTSALRNDLEALSFQQKATEAGIKIAKAGYYPSLSLTGGYIALDLKNVISVSNAMNFGVGFNYDLSSIFKNGKEVKLAKSKSDQTKQAIAILSDKIKEETQQAQENYMLSLKQNKVYALAVEQSTENYRIIKDKYDNSLANTNDLLEADVQQLQSKINLALCQADIALKYYQLQFASGKLINSFNLSTK